jgi:hypothetical protein
MRRPGIPIVVPIAMPSPPVGEGITAVRPKLGWVGGAVQHNTSLKQPLTRLRGVYHRAALRADPVVEPPSPTGGEGKSPATQRRQPA